MNDGDAAAALLWSYTAQQFDVININFGSKIKEHDGSRSRLAIWARTFGMLSYGLINWCSRNNVFFQSESSLWTVLERFSYQGPLLFQVLHYMNTIMTMIPYSKIYYKLDYFKRYFQYFIRSDERYKWWKHTVAWLSTIRIQ